MFSEHSREQAMALGLKRYFIGEPCKHGLSSPDCVECRRGRVRGWRAANPEKVREGDRERARKYRAADPERAREKWRKWRTAKLQRDRAADPVQEYRRAQWAAQRAAKLQKDPQVAKREARRLWWAAKRAAERHAARARAELNRGAGLTGAS